MFKLDNKGFAFSTILYGLMLMGVMIIIVIMSLMQTNRITNKKFVENIESELNRFSLTESTFNKVSYSDKGQEYIVPMGQSGWYKIELWGAQGGNNGGLGAYTSGLIWLRENTHLYFYVGKLGDTFNGGGDKAASGSIGGGATDVRLASGEWDDSLDKRIMVAAGGGGGSTGGDGGTIIGLSGTGTGAGAGGKQISDNSHFGQGISGSGTNGSGGGGGYYGGNGSSGSGGGGGGSSYISGYAGVYTKGVTGKDATYYHGTAEETSYTPGYFINGVMIPGVRRGDGAARIEKVISASSAIEIPSELNSKIYNTSFRYIKDCISGTKEIDTSTSSNTISASTWKGIQVIQNGKNIAYDKTMKIDNAGDDKKSSIGLGKIEVGSATKATATGSGEKCMVVDLGASVSNVSEIAVWHDFDTYNYDTGINAINHHLYIGNNLSSMIEITTGIANSLESAETYNGFHYSSWQTDTTLNSLDDGTYYIMSAASDNLFASYNAVDLNADFLLFNGSAKQQWNIKKTGVDTYLVTTVDGGHPLQVMDGTHYDNSYIGVKKLDGYYQWNQWFIKPAGNGMYYFYTTITDQAGVSKSSYLGMSFDDNKFYNTPKTLRSRTFVAPENDNHKGAINRLMKVRLLSVNY